MENWRLLYFFFAMEKLGNFLLNITDPTNINSTDD
jgi:hypothetical protein